MEVILREDVETLGTTGQIVKVSKDAKGIVRREVLTEKWSDWVDYWAVDFTRPTVIVLGNEGAGLSADLQHQATVQVRIPMERAVESLNVGIAAALLLYEARRQRWVEG